MKKAVICVLLFATTAFGQLEKAQIDSFKKESAGLRDAIADAMSILPGRSYLDAPKATYLEGYGAVFTLEASLGPIVSPFTSPKSPQEVRATVSERRKQITERLEAVLKQRAGALQSIAPTESVTVVLYLLNANRADVPDLPGQIIFTVKKQDPTQVIVRPF